MPFNVKVLCEISREFLVLFKCFNLTRYGGNGYMASNREGNFGLG